MFLIREVTYHEAKAAAKMKRQNEPITAITIPEIAPVDKVDEEKEELISFEHVEEHPSALFIFASSHSSSPAIIPSPQVVAHNPQK